MDVWRSVWAPAVAGLSFAAVLLVPAYGPLVDHHYAERLPFHAHLSDSAPHVHAYFEIHGHPATSPDAPDLATAIPSDDGVPSSPVGAGIDDGLALRAAIEPPVGLEQPAAYLSRPGEMSQAPPLRPPRTSV